MTDLSTRAIVLHRHAYNDRYCIVHVYSEQYGRLSLLVPQQARGRSRYLQLLMPLAQVELTARQRPRAQMAYLSEVRLVASHHRLHIDPVRRSQVTFLSELLYRILQHTYPDPDMYEFLASSIDILEHSSRGIANFYLCFCLGLLRHLAIAPEIDREAITLGMWYDLEEVAFVPAPSIRQHCLSPAEAMHLCWLSRMTYANMWAFRYTREQRGAILDRLLEFYRLHLPPFGTIRCLEILRGHQAIQMPPPTTQSISHA